MSMTEDRADRSAVNAVARRYARQGYRVTRPGPGCPAPAFLGGFVPDLIAEHASDRVVVEVKRSDLVPGANELTAVAERVAGQPGWRFELVALPPVRGERRRRIARGLIDSARRYLDQGLSEPALILASNAAEEALLALAEGQDRMAGEKSLGRLARDLATMGIIDGEDALVVDQARGMRERIIASGQRAAPDPVVVERLIATTDRLLAEAAPPAR